MRGRSLLIPGAAVLLVRLEPGVCVMGIREIRLQE
jgi:hypothetical protein